MYSPRHVSDPKQRERPIPSARHASPLSRRSFVTNAAKVGGLATLGATAGFSALSSSADADTDTGGALTTTPTAPNEVLTTVQPLHSDVVNQSYGIQLHSSYRGTVYEQYDAIATLLKDLGVRSVRDRLTPAVPGSVAFLRQLGTMGIKTHATMGSFPTTDDLRAKLAQTAATMTDTLECMAGYNEPNFAGRPSNWATLTAQHQQWLWNLGRQIGVPVGSPALHGEVPTLPQDYQALASLGVGNTCSIINIHRYPGGLSPSQLIDQRTALARSELGNKVVHCSEGGYFTALGSTGVGNPVSEGAQAIYAPRHLMEYVLRGGKFWQYELMDDPDPTRCDREKNLGMVAVGSTSPSSWRLKPAFAAMKDLLAATSDPGAAYTPRPLHMKITGPSDLRWLAFGKRDDSRFLIVWRDVNVWNTSTKSDIGVAPATVTVVARQTRTFAIDGKIRIIRMGKNA
jgi:hypothetical protein